MQSPPSQLKNEIVRAGAGAGKTTILTRRIFDFLNNYHEANGVWPRVVATTFTKKATQELEERLLLKALELQNFELIKYISESTGLFISTIHGVLNRFLQTYGYMVGIESGFEVITDTGAKYFVKKIIRDIINEDPSLVEPLLKVFNFKQLMNMVADFSDLRAQHGPTSHFTKEDFKKVYESKKQWLKMNIAEVCQEIEQNIEQKSWLSYAEKFRKLADIDFENAIDYSLAVKEIGRKPSKNKNVPEEINDLLEGCLEIIKKDFSLPAYQKGFWQSSEEIAKDFTNFFEVFEEKYKSYKLNNSLIEVSDLENYSHQIIIEKPELARLFSSQWHYWLVDEYQDTSPLQVSILESFVGSAPVFVVGDPQQSIYLFRGARSEVFDQQEAKIKEQGGEANFLQKNYRSGPELLMFFNHFFQQVGSQFQEMKPKHEEFDNKAVVASIACLPLKNGEGEVKDQNERNFIVGEILKLIENGVKYDDICILSRTNSYLKKMAQELKQYNIPVNLYSSGGFSHRREILDAMAFLKFLVNPYDNTNLITMLRSPWFLIRDEDLVSALQRREKNVWVTLKEKLSDHEQVKRLVQIMSKCESYGISYTFKNELLKSGFVDYSLTYDSTGRRESNFWKLVQKLADAERKPGFNYLEFIQEILGGTDVDILSEEGDAVASLEPNCINMMTVHASKGLQYKYVFIPQMNKRPMVQKSSSKKDLIVVNEKQHKWALYNLSEEDSIAPTVFHLDYVKALEERELLESQRLLYVSLTRASEKIYMSFTEKIDKNSWASLFEVPVEGVHCKEHYSFEIINSEQDVPSKKGTESSREGEQSFLEKYVTQDENKNNLFKKISVSEVLQTESENKMQPPSRPEEDVKESLQGLKKSSHGSLLHRLFELLKFHSESDLSFLIEKWFPNDVEDVTKALEFIKKLREPNLMEIIKSGQVEWGFQLKTEAGLIEGQIDLWGEDHENIWVVDYKSGAERYLDKAFLQLSYYARAIQKIRTDKSIKLMVVYPYTQKVHIRNI